MKNLKSLRKSKGIRQQTIADYLGISRPTYSRYESGEREPDQNTLTRLADYFGVSVDYLIGRDVPSEPELTLDDFEYALYGETRELNDNEKQELLEVAKFIKKKRQEMREKGWIPKND